MHVLSASNKMAFPTDNLSDVSTEECITASFRYTECGKGKKTANRLVGDPEKCLLESDGRAADHPLPFRL